LLAFPLRQLRAVAIATSVCATLLLQVPASHAADDNSESAERLLDLQLEITLRQAGFTGKVGSSLAARLGRPIDPRLADIGRKLFFDPLPNLHSDNACAGCHAPNAGFGDTQSIAIGVENNRIVGPDRSGPRNQRRAPSVLNTPFFSKLMWNGRFGAPSGNPFDNSQGYSFPSPEGTTRFPANDPIVKHLLIAHAHMPVTELNEAAGFTGTKGTISPRFDAFDDGLGGVVPMPDASGFRNDPIRQAVVQRLNSTPAYRELFGTVFPEVRNGGPIEFMMYARAIAEFEFTLVRANAPIDQFARGDRKALRVPEKRGALLFFGKANCVACHSVAGNANEMFSDFQNHVIGVPQIAPYFGLGKGDTIFDGPGEDEDFGLEQVTGNPQDRYRFRTSPLRNVALQRTFFHNGAFTRLEDAIEHHLDPQVSARQYNGKRAGVASDLQLRKGPVEPVLQRIDPLLVNGTPLTKQELRELVSFVREGLLDQRAASENFCTQIPNSLPSNLPPLVFQGCKK
jgi:cytochrome c peroxidase